MWKIVVGIVILVIVGIFIPRYDLERRRAMLSDDFELIEKGLWSADKCHARGKQFEHGYRCVTTSAWRTMTSSQRNYNKAREVD